MGHSTSRSKKAKINAIWGLICKFITMIGPFVIRTVIIKEIGVEYVGLNSLFTSVLTVLNMSEMGLGVAIIYNMYRPIADDNIEEICALLNLYRKVYRMIGCAILTIGIILSPFIPLMISGDVPSGINIYLLYFIFLLNTVVSYLMFSYKVCLLNAHQRNDIDSKISTGLSLFMYLAQAYILIRWKNYYAYAFVLLFYTVFYNISVYIYTKFKYPMYICKGNVEDKTLADLKQQVRSLFIVKVATATRNSFDSIVISATLGLASVAIYNNYYYILNAVAVFVSVLCTAISGGIGNSLVCDSIDKNHKDFIRISNAYIWVCGCCTACLMVLYQPFMNIWVGTDYMVPNFTMILFSAYFILTRVNNVGGQYLDAAGLFAERKLYAILESVANIVLNILFGKLWGMNGIIIATMITIYFACFLPVSHIVYNHIFLNSCIKFCAFQTAFMVIIVFISVGIYRFCDMLFLSFNHVNNIIELVLRLIITIFLYNGLMIMIFGCTKEFKDNTIWLKDRIIGKKCLLWKT